MQVKALDGVVKACRRDEQYFMEKAINKVNNILSQRTKCFWNDFLQSTQKPVNIS